jgi:hypothetical protein
VGASGKVASSYYSSAREENTDLDYVTKEDFLRDAPRQKLQDIEKTKSEHAKAKERTSFG